MLRCRKISDPARGDKRAVFVDDELRMNQQYNVGANRANIMDSAV